MLFVFTQGHQGDTVPCSHLSAYAISLPGMHLTKHGLTSYFFMKQINPSQSDSSFCQAATQYLLVLQFSLSSLAMWEGKGDIGQGSDIILNFSCCTVSSTMAETILIALYHLSQ